MESRSGGSGRTRWPALDGIRALAVLAVLCVHWHPSQFAGGFIGVDMFFVLSGFLITSVLLSEVRRTEIINLGHFYARRALRLLPALACMLIVVSLAVESIPQLAPVRANAIGGLVWVVFYAGNWAIVTGHNLGILTPTWSLSLEEQFYLLWPLALLPLLPRIGRG